MYNDETTKNICNNDSKLITTIYDRILERCRFSLNTIVYVMPYEADKILYILIVFDINTLSQKIFMLKQDNAVISPLSIKHTYHLTGIQLPPLSDTLIHSSLILSSLNIW